MRPGDGVFFYHSSCEVNRASSALPKVGKTAHADPTQFDPRSDYFDPKSSREAPRWSMMEVKYKRKLKRNITLTELKSMPRVARFGLLRPGNRLSVLPVSKKRSGISSCSLQ